MPRATRSSLTVTNSCGSSASRPERDHAAGQRAADVLGEALERVDGLEVQDRARRTRRRARWSSRLGGHLARAWGGPPAAAPAFRRRFVSRSSSWSAVIRSSTRLRRPGADRGDGRARRGAKRSSIRRSAAAPVTASMRRMPEPMLRSPVMMKPPIWPDARQCVPPHSSWLNPSTRIVRTRSPYFSSKNASAPASWASAMRHPLDADLAVLAHDAAHLALDGQLLVVGQAAVEREVEAQVVGRHERARLARPLPHHVAQRAMEQVRAGVVAHRVRASLRRPPRPAGRRRPGPPRGACPGGR